MRTLSKMPSSQVKFIQKLAILIFSLDFHSIFRNTWNLYFSEHFNCSSNSMSDVIQRSSTNIESFIDVFTFRNLRKMPNDDNEQCVERARVRQKSDRTFSFSIRIDSVVAFCFCIHFSSSEQSSVAFPVNCAPFQWFYWFIIYEIMKIEEHIKLIAYPTQWCFCRRQPPQPSPSSLSSYRCCRISSIIFVCRCAVGTERSDASKNCKWRECARVLDFFSVLFSRIETFFFVLFVS